MRIDVVTIFPDYLVPLREALLGRAIERGLIELGVHDLRNWTHDVHRAVAQGFVDRGYDLGHVTGHSIGMTMIEFPKIGEGVESVLEENMVFSMHPHAISADGQACLYMQDTWHVGADRGTPLAALEMKIFRGDESRPT